MVALPCKGTALVQKGHNMNAHTDLNTIWWQVYPLGFTGAPIRPTTPDERALTPRLDRIIPWLDYLIDLGANGLLLGPIFESESHGYDTTDYFQVDSRLGDDASIDRLIEACHDRGIRVMFDGVFNHVGSHHPWFRQAMAGEAHLDAFTIEQHGDAPATYRTFEGYEALPELNHDAVEVIHLVDEVMRFWLRRGIDAWRLDAAYAVPPAFWSHVLPGVREEFPDAWFMGEVIHGDYPAIIERSGMDSLTQYELWKAIWSSIREGNFFELDWSLKRHNEFMKSFTPLTFIGNHDVTRIASQDGPAGAAVAAAIQFTVGGVPSIYYGDEWAFLGVKEERLGGDDEVRPAFPASAVQLDPHGRRMFLIYQDLIALRRRNPWLAEATTEPTLVENRSYAYDAIGVGGQRLHVSATLDPNARAEISQDGKIVLNVDYENDQRSS